MEHHYEMKSAWHHALSNEPSVCVAHIKGQQRMIPSNVEGPPVPSSAVASGTQPVMYRLPVSVWQMPCEALHGKAARAWPEGGVARTFPLLLAAIAGHASKRPINAVK